MTISEYNDVCAYLRNVIKDTSWEGHVFTVGGCVRDMLMDREIHDVDLAVTMPDGGVMFAIWLEQKGLTADTPVLFPRFSTSKLRLKKFPDLEIEIVQTRSEQYTDANSRNPEICFGSIEEDCLRRDLTINSLYQNISTGEILDITGRGKDDIANRRIRTPMTPEETFSDDPIRILRAIRFAVKYGWPIPPDMLQAMKENSGRMKIVRRSRLSSEFEKALAGPDPVKVLKLLREVGALYRILPELHHLFRKKIKDTRKKNEKHHRLPTLWEVTLKNLEDTPPVLSERFAALFREFEHVKIPYSFSNSKDSRRRQPKMRGRQAVVQTALKRLHYDPAFIREVNSILSPADKKRDKYQSLDACL